MEQVNDSDWIFIIDTAWGDRWQIHRRLQELEIPCECSTGQLLVVTVNTPTAAIQVWSVTRQQSIPHGGGFANGRSQSIDLLNRCFNLQAVGIAFQNENSHDSELLND
ncbi:Asr1405/Asl0597 family protein [Chamaesiphon sp. VAR_48_metabat_403]|uniref:Asr1405/Asl0597 family protein n=1 Tax=Chamaesiphon sp. VAR_48_metabat_403 TaxID=2964700 RepID=UPI00286DA0E5|nr:Asr1405/Asl0597 family protein [Chamaesiphon sp. VAR_48_metabat_403]